MIERRHALAAISGLGVAALLCAVMLVVHARQRRLVIAASCASMQQRQQLVATSLNQVFERTEQRARELVQQINWGRPSRTQLIAALDAKLLNDGESVQFGVFLPAQNVVDPGSRFAISEVYDASGLHTVDFVRDGYLYWTMPWYRQTVASKRGSWSAPYFNEAAGGLDTVTYDYPLPAADGRPAGMVSISLSLGRLADVARNLGWHDGAGQDSLLLDAKGRILLSSRPGLERVYSLDSPAARQAMPLVAWAAAHPQTATPLQSCDADDAGVSYAQFAVPRVGWRVASAIDTVPALAALRRMLLLGMALALLLGLVVAVLIDWSLRRQRRPLQLLTASVERFAAGQFEHALPPPAALGECAALGDALERARQAAQGQRGKAKEERDARLREEGRRGLAGSLQRAQWPVDRVVFGRQLQAQACGGLRAAQDDGTGFYGVVPLAPGSFVTYLGGIRGEAAVAVLQLGRIASLLDLLAPQAATPGDLLAAVAAQLERGEFGDIALELLVARVELDARQLLLAGAGAGFGLLLQAGGQQRLPVPAGPCVRRGEPGVWPSWQGTCAPGDRLLLASPSLHEAALDDDLHEVQVAVERHAELPPRGMLDALLDDTATRLPGHPRDLLAVVLAFRHRD